MIVDGVPKSVGTFHVDSEGDSVIKIDSLKKYGNVEKFLVTIEPDGGAQKPSGSELLRGHIDLTGLEPSRVAKFTQTAP